MSDGLQGLKLGLKLELYYLTNKLLRFYLLQLENPRIICAEFKFFLGQLKKPKLKTAVS